jgi:hypothetical protein
MASAQRNVGGSQGEIKAAETGRIDAHDEYRSMEENCGCATEEMGAAEGEEGRLNQNAAIKVFGGRKLGRSSAEFSAMGTYQA